MNMWRVGEDRGSKETDRCPLIYAFILLFVTISTQNSAVFRGALRNFFNIPESSIVTKLHGQIASHSLL
jgi:hypothetical protein